MYKNHKNSGTYRCKMPAEARLQQPVKEMTIPSPYLILKRVKVLHHILAVLFLLLEGLSVRCSEGHRHVLQQTSSILMTSNSKATENQQ